MDILLIEDDTTLAMGIQYSLEKEGYRVISCENLELANEVDLKNINLILLDVTLPDGNGFEYCKKIRRKSDIPIIFLTACDEEANIVLGLDIGGDDYLTKPIRVRELISRINAVLRRRMVATNINSSGKIKTRDLVVDTSKVTVYKNNEKIQLTASEYKILINLIENKNRVLTRSQLLERLWDSEGDFIEEKTLNVYIKRLREKIGDGVNNIFYIETVRGVGYSWMDKG